MTLKFWNFVTVKKKFFLWDRKFTGWNLRQPLPPTRVWTFLFREATDGCDQSGKWRKGRKGLLTKEEGREGGEEGGRGLNSSNIITDNPFVFGGSDQSFPRKGKDGTMSGRTNLSRGPDKHTKIGVPPRRPFGPSVGQISKRRVRKPCGEMTPEFLDLNQIQSYLKKITYSITEYIRIRI